MKKAKNLFLMALIFLMVSNVVEAKKIKNTLKIDKKSIERDNVKNGNIEITLSDTLFSEDEKYSNLRSQLKECSFAGYDKEAASNIESFILVNSSDECITGFEVQIDYLDMQGRMFHSRRVKENCMIPSGESRRIDIKGWDKQHTYYYYLGNRPRKVATPFKVNFKPISYRIKE